MRGSNNPAGRPSRWEQGNPKVLAHVGAPKKEPADEFGLIKREHDTNVQAVEVFEAFAPVGSSQLDRDVKAIGMALVAKQQALGLARLESQDKLSTANEIKSNYKRQIVPPLEAPVIGTFFESVFFGSGCSTKPLVEDILKMLSGGAQYESTGTQPFDPTVGQIITSPEDKMRVLDTAFDALRHQIAQKVFAEALEANEKIVSLHTIQFHDACKGGSKVMLNLREVMQLTETIKTFRTNRQDEDIPAAVRLVCQQLEVAVPVGYLDPDAAAKPSTKRPRSPPPSPLPLRQLRTSSVLDAVSLKAMMTKMFYKNEDVSATMADDNDDGNVSSDEFGEWFKDYCDGLGIEEPTTEDITREWDTLTGGGKEMMPLLESLGGGSTRVGAACFERVS